MTGTQLKAFAKDLHDDAIIQILPSNAYRMEWQELTIRTVRAVHTVRPDDVMVEPASSAVEG